MAIYAQKLLTYSTTAIEAGISSTIELWDKPNMAPTLAFILTRIHEHLDRARLERQGLMAVLPPPQLDSSSPAQRRRESQRIILESKASGCWGPDAIGPAKAALAKLDAGEAVTAPASIGEVMSAVMGPPTRDAKQAAANDDDEDDSDGEMAYRE